MIQWRPRHAHPCMPGVKILKEMRHEFEGVVGSGIGHAEGLPKDDETKKVILVSLLSRDRLTIRSGVNLRESSSEGGPTACT